MSKIDKCKYYSIPVESKETLRSLREKSIFMLNISVNSELLIGMEYDSEYNATTLTREDCLKLSRAFAEIAECFTD